MASKSLKRATQELCENCSTDLTGAERALFVEEEIGRVFCNEECIASYFGPQIDRLEKEFFRKLSPRDLNGEQREQLAHLRWITLKEPDEVWREKTLTGDYRYTLISEFTPDHKRVWCICICLFLRGEPSFLFLAFPTRNAAMANHYRKGEQVEWTGHTTEGPRGSELIQTHKGEEAGESGEEGDSDEDPRNMNRLASAWTQDETFRAQMNQERSAEDIPESEFSSYQKCLEETLETPDEVWSLQVNASETAPKLYHFIRHYPEEGRGIWYVIIAKETEDDEQIEILDAFPTRDPYLVDRYRQGEQEVGQTAATQTAARVLH